MGKTTFFKIESSPKGIFLRCIGAWRTENVEKIEKSFEKIVARLENEERVWLDTSKITHLDTGGMLFFLQMRKRLKQHTTLHVEGVSQEFCHLFRLVLRYRSHYMEPIRPPWIDLGKLLVTIGKTIEAIWLDLILFLNFLGALTLATLKSVIHPSYIRFKETSSNIFKAGVTAIPIVALSAFLVGVVIAYQSAVQLQKYGANIFIVDMIGISIPRELAPLITAIIVAGRSGSSYTAQIGVMKITEEIDAMKTMGFEIYRFVILPRIFAMIVALPLLIFFADVVGIYAGILVAKAQLGITPEHFLQRLQTAVDVRHYLVGLFKAPFFAFIIAAIGCFRGFQVAGNTESIGRYTTISVVNAIFLVVALDALFSIIFTELEI